MTLTFDRPALTAALPNIGDLHGMQLRMGEARTRLLSRSVSIINQSLPHLSQADGPAISNLMTQLLGACLTPKSRRTDIMRLALHQARQQVAKLFIEINLPDPNLDPLSVARQCGLSRSALFELFRDSGGISHYIWMRRLQRAADDLLDPSYGHLSMGEIAEKLGFNHQAHFSLAFKRRFGMTAKEWRQSARSTGYISRSHDHSFYLAQQLKQAVGNGAVKH
jgi:AraC-like DNA-binding protein